jgi:hypothetical protein
MTAQIIAFPSTPTRHAKATMNHARNLHALWQPRCGDWVHDSVHGRPLQLKGFNGYPDRVLQWSAWCPATRLTVLRSPMELEPLHPALWPQGGAA